MNRSNLPINNSAPHADMAKGLKNPQPMAHNANKCISDFAISKHFKVLSLKCHVENCNAEFVSRRLLRDHLSDAHQTAAFRCKVAGCNMSFMNSYVDYRLFDSILLLELVVWHRYLYALHNLSAHEFCAFNRAWPCCVCGGSYASRQSLSVHYNNYHQLGRFKCKYCDFMSDKTLSVLYKHIRRAHWAWLWSQFTRVNLLPDYYGRVVCCATAQVHYKF